MRCFEETLWDSHYLPGFLWHEKKNGPKLFTVRDRFHLLTKGIEWTINTKVLQIAFQTDAKMLYDEV